MALTDADITAIVRRHLDKAQVTPCEVRWDTALRGEGEIVQAGPAEQPMPFEGHLVFVDLQPEANWGHPVLYLFVTPDGRRVEVAQGQFPPYFEGYPASFRTLTLGAASS